MITLKSNPFSNILGSESADTFSCCSALTSSSCSIGWSLLISFWFIAISLCSNKKEWLDNVEPLVNLPRR